MLLLLHLIRTTKCYRFQVYSNTRAIPTTLRVRHTNVAASTTVPTTKNTHNYRVSMLRSSSLPITTPQPNLPKPKHLTSFPAPPSSPFPRSSLPSAPPPSPATGEWLPGTGAAGAPKLGFHSAASALGFHVDGDNPGEDFEASPDSSCSDPPSTLDSGGTMVGVGVGPSSTGVGAGVATAGSVTADIALSSDLVTAMKTEKRT